MDPAAPLFSSQLSGRLVISPLFRRRTSTSRSRMTHAHSLFLPTETRRPAGDAAAGEKYPDVEARRLGEEETGRRGDDETGRRIGRVRRERNRSLRFGCSALDGRNPSLRFGCFEIEGRNRSLRFGCFETEGRNPSLRFGLGSLRGRNLGAFWHFRGRLAPNGMRGGCRGS